jgi:hypothetical protein
MALDFDACRRVTDGCDRVFDRWRLEMEQFREEMRELKNYKISKTDFAAKVRSLTLTCLCA